jgi:release factor glutamine methyltransferase
VEAELASAAENGDAAAVDARRIVERASGYDGAELLLHLDERVPDRARLRCTRMVTRRRAGAPLQYAIGAWGFRTLELYLDGRVLIPRPETELVVEVALEELSRLGAPEPVVVDLGTGSGAIALSMAAEGHDARVWGTDVSADALAVARANLAGMGGRAAARVRLAEGSWFDALPGDLRGQVHLIVSNPPYVADGETLPAEVADWEPVGALRAGPTGMEAIAAVLAGASDWLTRPGAAVVELAPHQAEAATALARASRLVDVEVRADLSGRPRTLVGRV